MIKFLTNPYYAFLLIIIIVLILLAVYKFIAKPKEKFFLSNELFLLIIGIIGVLAIVSKNQDLKNEFELEKRKNWILSDYRFMKSHLNSNYYCLEYTKSPYLSDEEFNKRNNTRIKTCEWIIEVKKIVENVNIKEFKKIPTIPEITEDMKNQYGDIDNIEIDISKINKMIEERNGMEKENNGINILGNIDETLGILFLLVGLGIKFSELVYKLKK